MKGKTSISSKRKSADATEFRANSFDKPGSKKNVLGVLIDPATYQSTVEEVIGAARAHRPCAVSALAVHGTMLGVFDPVHRYRLNRFDLLVPDGQPVRWALNLLHRASLDDRVYGPKLTLLLFERAMKEKLRVYLYGTTQETLDRLKHELHRRFPDLEIAGAMPSRFRQVSEQEKADIVQEIRNSGARIVFTALGCPRQEVWAYEHRDLLSVPIIAIGAAFPFIAGTLKQAPNVLQRFGLEWLFRLVHEPARLWRRYVLLNPAYVFLVALQRLGRNFDVHGAAPDQDALFG